jgi:enoyl-CoA hydratase
VSTVRVDRPVRSVSLVTLDRQERLNAFDQAMIQELHALLDDIAQDHSCRAVVLTGAGRGFCSGLDLDAFGGSMADDDASGRVQATMRFQEAISALVCKVRYLPQPVIAAVNGPASGGGLALALACDIRLCAPAARFNAAFVRLGVSGCDVGVSWLLPRIVGPTLAFEMMLTGRLVEAEEAARHGLVLRVVPEECLLDEAIDIAQAIAANSPFGVRMTKQTMWANLETPSLERAIDLENRTQVLCLQTEDCAEAARAFREKRPARFKNR